MDCCIAFHPQTDGQTERMNQVLEDILRACVIDFQDSWKECLPIVEFAYNNSYHSTTGVAPYEALYERPCKTLINWAESEDSLLLGPELVRETTEKVAVIRDHILVAQSRQKSYADMRRRPFEFAVGDLVMLKVSPMKGVRRFGKKGKLTSKFIGPFRIIVRIRAVLYRLDLPESIAGVHDVFHVSMLRKHLGGEEQQHVADLSELQLQPDLTTVEASVHVLAREDKRQRNKVIPLVKVQLNCSSMEEVSWEREEDMHRVFL